MHIIVDGYNLIRQSDALRTRERISLEAGRKALVQILAAYRRVRGHRITVVFDGWAGGSPTEERDCAGGIDIIYSRLGEKADEVIKRLVGEGSEEILVVTSDREVAGFAARHGKAAVGSPDFAHRIEGLEAGPPGGGPSAGDEDADAAGSAKKKGPSRRLSRQKRTQLARLRKL